MVEFALRRRCRHEPRVCATGISRGSPDRLPANAPSSASGWCDRAGAQGSADRSLLLAGLGLPHRERLDDLAAPAKNR